MEYAVAGGESSPGAMVAAAGSKPEDPLVLPGLLAVQFKVKPNTLAKWRMLGTGPKFVRLSANRVAYRQSAIDEWLKNREFTSTLEESRKVPASA